MPNTLLELHLLQELLCPYVSYNGYIKIQHLDAFDQGQTLEGNMHLFRGGHPLHGLLMDDSFGELDEPVTKAQRVEDTYYHGSRLYLIEEGKWLQQNRKGHWQDGSTNWWSDTGEMSDQEVANEYVVADLHRQASLTMSKMAGKLRATNPAIATDAAIVALRLTALSLDPPKFQGEPEVTTLQQLIARAEEYDEIEDLDPFTDAQLASIIIKLGPDQMGWEVWEIQGWSERTWAFFKELTPWIEIIREKDFLGRDDLSADTVVSLAQALFGN